MLSLGAEQSPGTIAEIAREHEAELILHRAGRGPWCGPIRALEAVFVVGAPVGPKPWCTREVALMHRLLLARRPVLAVGAAARLLALACGGRVDAALDDDEGPNAVVLTDEGCVDPVLGAGPSPMPVFSWRPAALELPATARSLAMSAFCGQQAFRLDRNAYGVQFHPEIDAHLVRTWAPHLTPDVLPSPAALDELTASGRALLNAFAGVLPTE